VWSPHLSLACFELLGDLFVLSRLLLGEVLLLLLDLRLHSHPFVR
jgi:hypothetical protein